MPKLEAISPTRGPAFSSDQHAMTASTATARHHKSRSGLEAMESDGERISSVKVQRRSRCFKTRFLDQAPLVCSSQRVPTKTKRTRALKNPWKMRVKRT